jgi:ABC-type bacteriocin/lantibiotic exporter with double-glycine peptidase domain
LPVFWGLNKEMLFDASRKTLDNHTQVEVNASLDLLDVTRIAIAYRLSTIRNADRIYVIESGQLYKKAVLLNWLSRRSYLLN